MSNFYPLPEHPPEAHVCKLNACRVVYLSTAIRVHDAKKIVLLEANGK